MRLVEKDERGGQAVSNEGCILALLVKPVIWVNGAYAIIRREQTRRPGKTGQQKPVAKTIIAFKVVTRLSVLINV